MRADNRSEGKTDLREKIDKKENRSDWKIEIRRRKQNKI